jgi:probable phosphoglycerate mutase
MRLYLIRHADPDYPNNTITPAGHLEAKALAKRLAYEGVTHLFASPLGRAIDTMKYTAKKTGLPWEILDWTQELHLLTKVPGLGDHAAWDMHGEIIRRELPRHLGKVVDYAPSIDLPKVKKDFESLKKSSAAFLSRFGYEREDGVYRVKAPNRFRVAVFCHGGFGLTWLAHLLEIPLAQMYAGFFLPPSSVTTVLMDERSHEFATPRAIGVGDVAHLYNAKLPTQPSGVKSSFF